MRIVLLILCTVGSLTHAVMLPLKNSYLPPKSNAIQQDEPQIEVLHDSPVENDKGANTSAATVAADATQYLNNRQQPGFFNPSPGNPNFGFPNSPQSNFIPGAPTNYVPGPQLPGFESFSSTMQFGFLPFGGPGSGQNPTIDPLLAGAPFLPSHYHPGYSQQNPNFGAGGFPGGQIPNFPYQGFPGGQGLPNYPNYPGTNLPNPYFGAGPFNPQLQNFGNQFNPNFPGGNFPNNANFPNQRFPIPSSSNSAFLPSNSAGFPGSIVASAGGGGAAAAADTQADGRTKATDNRQSRVASDTVYGTNGGYVYKKH